ncbi:MAG: molybdenum cofactor guanylyltransferase [Deltaproteobacteria bacterium]|nr:MAG: molybdenum cofactor guanylyltransferase [Deltaproteobacteria bacterium]
MARDACAVVLAGGESRRFGSDKALARFRGEPLIARVVRELRNVGFNQVAIAAKEPEKYADAAPGAELLRDVRPIQTPLAGLAAGLRASRHALVFACAADMPFAADAALIDALTAAIAGHDAAVPHAAGSLQPLCGLWWKDACLRAAEALLARPRPPGPRAILPLVRAARLDWPDPRPFLDADTPEVLRELELAS